MQDTVGLPRNEQSDSPGANPGFRLSGPLHPPRCREPNRRTGATLRTASFSVAGFGKRRKLTTPASPRPLAEADGARVNETLSVRV